VSVLFITQRFPPATGAAARRLTHLGRAFAEKGQLYVIRKGSGNNKIPGLTAQFSLAGFDVRRLLGYENKTLDGGVRENRLLKHLLPLRQSTPFLYLTDDGGPHYRRQAYQKAGELIEKHGITTVFSSFRPWSDHLVARKLKARYPHLYWIADFRDLPVDPVRKDVWWPALQTWWGKRVIASADETWCVSEGQKAQLAAWHPNIRVVRNALLALPPPGLPPVTARFDIVYTGSLYPGLQSVAPLVAALQQLLTDGTLPAHHLCLRYRGKDADLFRSWTAELPAACLDIQPAIAPAAAQKMQQNAQILLLLNWSAPGYYGVLTAKLWDYLASGRPILALVNGPGDKELSDIILGANAGAVFSIKEQGEVEHWLRSRYLHWAKNGRLPWPVDRENLRQYL
jgi:hypothetical protein